MSVTLVYSGVILCATSWDSCLCSSLTTYNDNNVPRWQQVEYPASLPAPGENINKAGAKGPETIRLQLAAHMTHRGVHTCLTHSGVIKTCHIGNISVIIQTCCYFCFLVMRLAPCTSKTSHQECHSHLFAPPQLMCKGATARPKCIWSCKTLTRKFPVLYKTEATPFKPPEGWLGWIITCQTVSLRHSGLVQAVAQKIYFPSRWHNRTL